MRQESFDVDLEKRNQASLEQARYLKRLWVKFNFPFTPPKPGSLAEMRLHNYCDVYCNMVIGSNSTTATLEGGSTSDIKRRDLHNQIATMVKGAQRSNMSPAEAREIADFAFQFSKGVSIDEAEANPSIVNGVDNQE